MSSSSIWPYEYLREPHDLPRKHSNHLICFLICPFKPQDRFDELFDFIQDTCKHVGLSIGAEVECIRADKIATPGVIHQDIWAYVQMADVIIADVTERNGNVMLELGVAASCREKEQVIIIRDEDDTQPFLFDISPARHLLYKRGLFGAVDFRTRLEYALIHALTPAPYTPPSLAEPALPIKLDLAIRDDHQVLLSPSVALRRRLPDGVEFGSWYVFRNSWLTVGRSSYRNVQVKAEVKFTALAPNTSPGDAWVGIMLRSNHFFADYGHLIYVRADGRAMHTVPLDEYSKDPDDPLLGNLTPFMPTMPTWISFDLRFDEVALAGTVNGVLVNLPVAQMPYTYNAGLIRVQTFRARACLRRLSIEAA